MKPLNFSPLALASAFYGTGAMAQGFGGLGFLPGGSGTGAYAISADGSTVVGQTFNASGTVRAFRWTGAGGLQDLGSIVAGPGGISYARGTSQDGSVVVGTSPTILGVNRAFRWTAATGLVDIDPLRVFGGRTEANAVSGNGAVITGNTFDISAQLAFRWEAGAMETLPLLIGGTQSFGNAVSFDGSVIVGTGNMNTPDGNLYRAFRWTRTGGTEDLGTIGTGRFSQGTGVSADGSVVVGYGERSGTTGVVSAFRWTRAGGMQAITDGTENRSEAAGVSANGEVVVGGYELPGGQDVAFRWTQATGMQSVTNWLSTAGVATTGWSLQNATSTNADGSVVVGTGSNPDGEDEGWIARISGLGSGVMSPGNYMRSAVTARQATLQSGQQLARFILWGAHHRPLMSYGNLGGDRGCFWATGDIGGRNNPSDTEDTLAETGVCGDFAGGTVRAGIGLGYGKRTMGLGEFGSTQLAGNHLVAEISARPVAGMMLSATAVHGRWNADTRRGYRGAAGTDFSSGGARVESTALRVRADWENLWTAGNTPLTPYVAAAVYRTRTGGYTETGGGFPARFDSQTQTELESRIGITGSHALTPTTTLRPAAEAVVRLDHGSPRVKGQVLGLFSFDQELANQRRAWLRVGADLDHQLNKSTLLSFSLHAASRGDDPRLSGAVSLRMGF